MSKYIILAFLCIVAVYGVHAQNVGGAAANGDVTFTGNVFAPNIGGSLSLTGTAGQTLYVSATNTAAGTSVTRDMLGESGADLGAKMNNCASNLPAAGGTCKGDNLPASTLSTAVTTAKAVVYTFCGQAVSQTGAISLAGANSAIVGCAGRKTTFTKGANIDQITTSATGVEIKDISIAGVKGTFTGNGIVLNSGTLNTVVSGNIITAEANDDIQDNSATNASNQVQNNTLNSWGVHAFEGTGTIPTTLLVANKIIGDGTATGVAVVTSGGKVLNNIISDSNAAILLDTTLHAAVTNISGNSLTQTGGFQALKLLGGSIATNNFISGGGASGPAVTTAGYFANNSVTAANTSDGVDATNQAVVRGNQVGMTTSGTSNLCGINVTGDTVRIIVSENIVVLADSQAGDTEYGICLTPTGTHSLNNTISRNQVDATGVLATVNGYFFNNAANLNTNVGNLWEGNSCIHILGKCLKRVDTQNNRNVYKDFLLGDVSVANFDAGTGSNVDVFDIETFNFTFATLPSPMGNGSRVYCSDCTQAKPTASGGGGALVVREAGANNGL